MRHAIRPEEIAAHFSRAHKDTYTSERTRSVAFTWKMKLFITAQRKQKYSFPYDVAGARKQLNEYIRREKEKIQTRKPNDVLLPINTRRRARCGCRAMLCYHV